MSLTIVFDTNYLRSFSSKYYLDGGLPPEVEAQVERALSGGFAVMLLPTVRLEMNAWLSGLAAKHNADINAAVELLKNNGFTVSVPPISSEPRDIATVFRQKGVLTDFDVALADYREAERRTSYRLPPLPKNAEGEEFRDRLIWCQLLRYSSGGVRPVLMVSEDVLFRNGAKSQEGQAANVDVVGSVADLDQRLGQRSPQAQQILDLVRAAAEKFSARGVKFFATDVESVEQLRMTRQPDGSLWRRFLVTLAGSGHYQGLLKTDLKGMSWITLFDSDGQSTTVKLDDDIPNIGVDALHRSVVALAQLRQLVGENL